MNRSIWLQVIRIPQYCTKHCDLRPLSQFWVNVAISFCGALMQSTRFDTQKICAFALPSKKHTKFSVVSRGLLYLFFGGWGG